MSHRHLSNETSLQAKHTSNHSKMNTGHCFADLQFEIQARPHLDLANDLGSNGIKSTQERVHTVMQIMCKAGPVNLYMRCYFFS